MNSHSQDIEDELLSKLRKLAKRDKALYTAVQKKMVQITENPYLGKPLKGVLRGKRRELQEGGAERQLEEAEILRQGAVQSCNCETSHHSG